MSRTRSSSTSAESTTTSARGLGRPAPLRRISEPKPAEPVSRSTTIRAYRWVTQRKNFAASFSAEPTSVTTLCRPRSALVPGGHLAPPAGSQVRSGSDAHTRAHGRPRRGRSAGRSSTRISRPAFRRHRQPRMKPAIRCHPGRQHRCAQPTPPDSYCSYSTPARQSPTTQTATADSPSELNSAHRRAVVGRSPVCHRCRPGPHPLHWSKPAH